MNPQVYGSTKQHHHLLHQMRLRKQARVVITLLCPEERSHSRKLLLHTSEASKRPTEEAIFHASHWFTSPRA